MTQINREVVSPSNRIRGICTYRIREFLRMNPPQFSGSKVEEELNGFIDKVYKTLAIMGVTYRKKAGLATNELKYFHPNYV